MARTPSIVKLPPDQQCRIDALLRRYQYGCYDLIMTELSADGVPISRSALHRYGQRLKSLDSLQGNAPDSTVVIVVDLRTGAATQIRTAATPAVVISAIGALGPICDQPQAVDSEPTPNA